MSLLSRNAAMSSWSDDKLIMEVISGNKDAIVYMFYTKYSSIFQYHIYRLFGYRIDVVELVNELFLFLYEDDWRRLRTYDGGKASLSTWISAVSYRFFRDYKRSKDLKGLVSISDKCESFRCDWMQSVDSEIMMDIRTAIGEIKSRRDREIAELLFIEDKEYEVVAEKYALSIDYIYTIKNRVLKQMKNSLSSYHC